MNVRLFEQNIMLDFTFWWYKQAICCLHEENLWKFSVRLSPLGSSTCQIWALVKPFSSNLMRQWKMNSLETCSFPNARNLRPLSSNYNVILCSHFVWDSSHCLYEKLLIVCMRLSWSSVWDSPHCLYETPLYYCLNDSLLSFHCLYEAVLIVYHEISAWIHDHMR